MTITMERKRIMQTHKKLTIHFSKWYYILPCLRLMHSQTEQMQSHVICLCLDLFSGYIPARFHTLKNNPLYPLKHKFKLHALYPHSSDTNDSISNTSSDVKLKFFHVRWSVWKMWLIFDDWLHCCLKWCKQQVLLTVACRPIVTGTHTLVFLLP